MHFYIQFVVCLVVGLLGLCSALKILFDTLLLTWDPVAELRGTVDASRRRRSVAVWQLERALPGEEELEPS